MKDSVLPALLLVILLGLGVLASGCADADYARAERVRAEAEAYSIRVAADEARRENGHQRAVELLPYVLAIGGGILVLTLAGLLAWDLRSQRLARPVHPMPADPALLAYLERQDQRLAELERATYRAIAAAQRLGLANSESRKEVVVYQNKRT